MHRFLWSTQSTLINLIFAAPNAAKTYAAEYMVEIFKLSLIISKQSSIFHFESKRWSSNNEYRDIKLFWHCIAHAKVNNSVNWDQLHAILVISTWNQMNPVICVEEGENWRLHSALNGYNTSLTDYAWQRCHSHALCCSRQPFIYTCLSHLTPSLSLMSLLHLH